MIRAWALAAALLCGLAQGASQEAAAQPVATPPDFIPVLAYHRFDPARAVAATVVTTPVFTTQMEFLVAHHIQVVKLRDAMAELHGGKPIAPTVVLTADDGWRSVYTDMFPIIRRMNLPVTLFINPPMIGHGGAYMTWPMLTEMVQSGLVDVEPHTLSHPNFNTERTRRDPASYVAFVEHEIAGSRPAIIQELHLPADLLAWPFGIHDATLEAAARQAGYTAAFALGSRAMTATDPDFALPRYQVYDTDRDTRFAWIVAGHPRGLASRIVKK